MIYALFFTDSLFTQIDHVRIFINTMAINIIITFIKLESINSSEKKSNKQATGSRMKEKVRETNRPEK